MSYFRQIISINYGEKDYFFGKKLRTPFFSIWEANELTRSELTWKTSLFEVQGISVLLNVLSSGILTFFAFMVPRIENTMGVSLSEWGLNCKVFSSIDRDLHPVVFIFEVNFANITGWEVSVTGKTKRRKFKTFTIPFILKQKFLFLNSQPTDSQSGVITITQKSQIWVGDTEKLSMAFAILDWFTQFY